MRFERTIHFNSHQIDLRARAVQASLDLRGLLGNRVIRLELQQNSHPFYGLQIHFPKELYVFRVASRWPITVKPFIKQIKTTLKSGDLWSNLTFKWKIHAYVRRLVFGWYPALHCRSIARTYYWKNTCNATNNAHGLPPVCVNYLSNRHLETRRNKSYW